VLKIKATGGSRKEQIQAKKAILWSLKELKLSRLKGLQISLKIGELEDCYGYCEQIENREFNIGVDNTQDIKNFIMTVMHEMVHVKQYVRNKWVGDGEGEAWGLQEELTEKYNNS
tara:strand:- start:215 stop:559 length:345 start_codon:yes stop_codon:yes gene_type:complete